MREHLHRQDERPLGPPGAAIVAATSLGAAWVCLIVIRSVGLVDLSWWIVLSIPFVIPLCGLLYVGIALLLTFYFWLAARIKEWSMQRRHRVATRRAKEFFDRGLHISDRRDDPSHW